MAKVSIVAPVYGVEKYIKQFLDSIKNQTFQDIEVILVDDGSPDKCPSILDEFVKNDTRYKVIHQKNGGVSKARNAGLALATGTYVYIVDSDDWLTADAIEVLYNCAIKNDADVVYGDWYEEYDNGENKRIQCFSNEFVTMEKDTIKKMQCAVFSNNNSINLRSNDFACVQHMGGAPWRALVKTALIKDNGLQFDPYVRGLGDDILFTLHLYEHITKIAYIQHPIYHYREIQVSYSHGYKENYLETVSRIFEKMEVFLNEECLDNGRLWKFYYYRVLLYLKQGMERYFKNASNPKSEKERYKHFVDTLKQSPYKEAIKEVPLWAIKNRKTKLSFGLLRMKCYKLYWILKK